MPERMRAMTIAAFKEDKRMVEMQQRIHDATPDLVFQPTVHDRGANQMRLVMKRLMEAEQAA
jgi:phenylpropionate dioxygenase-like ring-hydroxylating dioxygenase large terminal subunit